MRIGELDIPGELLAAQRAGQLAVFAGAGVSMGLPANYPDFWGLVRRIGKDTGKVLESRAEPNERYWGRLEIAGVKVHELAKRLLDDSKSQPNSVHSSLVRVFAANGSPRIVTTNFDSHFTTEAGRLLPAGVEIHKAPALPVGGRFDGIVYLHGSVDGPADRLVLTDRDFGRAYLTEGWARRFLQDLYSVYTVLFIGYLLFVIKKAYDEFAQRAGESAAPKGEKAKLVSRAIRQQHGEFRLVDIEQASPGGGRDWIQTLLTEWKSDGRGSFAGKGPAARWWLVSKSKGSTPK